MSFASSSSAKAILCCLLCIFVSGVVSFKNTICPFDYLFHFGDGVFDDGNAIRTLPEGPSLPAVSLPYGETDPGYPTGRFCDGLLDIDFGARAMGFPEITPYLGGKTSQINAIMFAVARSPVLSRDFFTSKGIKLPSYVAPLEVQISWFKEYLNTVCTTPAECANILGNSFFLFGDVEANDITYALLQGKSIEEVKTYAPLVTQAQINVAREAISMGATRIVFPGNVPIGCYPFMLTDYLSINGSAAFDETGCLKDINDLIEFKNKDLSNSVNNLMKEFPHVTMFYADFYDAFVTMRREWHYSAGRNQDLTLKACCGIGGEYNYDGSRFCGSEGVSVCDDPLQYLHWDGIHLTHEANDRLSYILQQGALELLNCKTAELFKTPRRPLRTSQLFKTLRRPLKISQLLSSI